MTSRSILLQLVLVLTAFEAVSQTPIVNKVVPAAVAPGVPGDLTLFGDNLSRGSKLWTSFALETSPADLPDPGIDRATFRVKAPAEAKPGIGALRVLGSNGISSLQLVMIDPLPSVVEDEAHDTTASAQRLEQPVAVDGSCQQLKSDLFKFTARKGQRISVEVVAQRLGSLLDPRVRLLDGDGLELLVVDDTAGLGADCAFDYKVPRFGEYFLELRDTRYEGGPRHRYRLRVGDFERTRLPFLADAIPMDLRSPNLSIASVHTEREPNDSPHSANRLALPAVVSGSFAKASDRDFYEFAVEKNHRLLVRGQSRSLVFSCDLFLQIQDIRGIKVADADIAGADEGTITNTFKVAGIYRLMVEELNQLGGPELNYRLDLSLVQPGFALSAEQADVSVPVGGSFEVGVKPVRNGYDGPIRLQLVGLGPDFAATNDVITGKTNEVRLRVTVPPNLPAGEFRLFSIIGRGKTGEQTVEAQVTTLPALRKLFPEMPYPPEELDGLIGLGISSRK